MAQESGLPTRTVCAFTMYILPWIDAGTAQPDGLVGLTEANSQWANSAPPPLGPSIFATPTLAVGEVSNPLMQVSQAHYRAIGICVVVLRWDLPLISGLFVYLFFPANTLNLPTHMPGRLFT